jgi:DNA-binding LytR/AlgR family response regulator
MRCIAIDDEPLALKILGHYCDRTPSISLLGCYTDPLEGLLHIRASQPDLLFLDVCMPDMTGIDLAEALNGDVLVIFTTAHREYAVKGFELNVVDYLLKPFDFARFTSACAKAEDRLLLSRRDIAPAQPTTEETLLFRCNYRHIQLPMSRIVYIKAFDNYVKIVTEGKTYMPAMTLKTVMKLLPEAKFVRVHKSFVIPVSGIKSFNHETVILDRTKIPIGRTFLKDFLERMRRPSTTP